MTTSEIITLIAAIFTAIAAIAAAITCLLHYKSLKPKIRVRTYQNPVAYFYTNGTNFSCAFLGLEFVNNSNIPGTIEDIEIKYHREPYNAENDKLHFELDKDFAFTTDIGTKVSINELRIKCPIILEGYAFKEGFIIFPGLPKLGNSNINVDLFYKTTTRKRPYAIKKIKLTYSPQ